MWESSSAQTECALKAHKIEIRQTSANHRDALFARFQRKVSSSAGFVDSNDLVFVITLPYLPVALSQSSTVTTGDLESAHLLSCYHADLHSLDSTLESLYAKYQ